MDSSLALADCSSVLLRRRRCQRGGERKIELVGLGKLGREKISFIGNVYASLDIFFPYLFTEHLVCLA